MWSEGEWERAQWLAGDWGRKMGTVREVCLMILPWDTGDAFEKR